VLFFFPWDGSLPFMTRLPKKRGITQDGEDKSLILRHKQLGFRFLRGFPLEAIFEVRKFFCSQFQGGHFDSLPSEAWKSRNFHH